MTRLFQGKRLKWTFPSPSSQRGNRAEHLPYGAPRLMTEEEPSNRIKEPDAAEYAHDYKE